MTISRLLMPAVTLAGALALAGCGGGSGTPTTTGNGENGGGGERETNADDCGTGTVLRDGKCVADTSTADAAEATKAAQALYNLLGTSNAGTAPADLASGVLHPNQASASSTQFGAADDDDKYSQSVRLEGAKFSEATGINLGTLAETGALKDYYPIAGGHSNAEADGFGTISQEKHELADNVVYFEISGTYAGVSGTFRCAPGEVTAHLRTESRRMELGTSSRTTRTTESREIR